MLLKDSKEGKLIQLKSGTHFKYFSLELHALCEGLLENRVVFDKNCQWQERTVLPHKYQVKKVNLGLDPYQHSIGATGSLLCCDSHYSPLAAFSPICRQH